MKLIKKMAATAFLVALASPSFASEGMPQILNGIAANNEGGQAIVEHLSDADQQSLRGQLFAGANRAQNAADWCKGRGVCYVLVDGSFATAVDPYFNDRDRPRVRFAAR